MTTLAELVGALDDVELVGGVDDVGDVERVDRVEVTAVVHDSRRVVPGALFCALPGEIADGADFAADAVASGAEAVLTERPVAVDVPRLVVRDARHATGLVAAASR